MDQAKTGKFISELRREKDMKQSELADAIGVSAKTVSKWETGRGMPEISTLPLLCDTLGISVNELLSGERVETDNYTERAEENIVTLLKDSKSYNKDRTIPAVAAPVIAVAALALIILGIWGSGMSMYVDYPSLLFISAITTVFLVASGCYGDLWRAFRYAAGFGAPSKEQLENAKCAVSLAGKTLFASGSFLTVISLITSFTSADSLLDDAVFLLYMIEIAMLPLFYGLAGYLMSLPIKARLERRIIRALC